MRKHRHAPWFHKAHSKEAYRDKDGKLPEPTGRRAHRLTPREAPAPSVLAHAEKRQRLYMHAAARRRAP